MEKPRIAQPLSQKSTVPLLPLQSSSVRDLSVCASFAFDLPHSFPVLPCCESFLETFSLGSSDLPFFYHFQPYHFQWTHHSSANLPIPAHPVRCKVLVPISIHLNPNSRATALHQQIRLLVKLMSPYHSFNADLSISKELITPHDANGLSWGRILAHGIVVIVSLVALIAVFLYLVFSRGVKDVTGNHLASHVYVLNIPATVLLLPATLSGIVAVCSIGSVVFLSSCLHARHIVSKSETQRHALLSGRDAALLVELLTGRLSACCDGIKYSVIHAGRASRPQIVFASLLVSILLLKR